MTRATRIILGFAAMTFALFCVPADAATQASTGAEKWVSYGASQSYHRDVSVPGSEIVQIHIEERKAPGKAWDSGAIIPLPFALRQGERVSVAFWARAERATSLPVLLQAGAPPYAYFAAQTIALTPTWQRFILTGTAPSDLAVGTQHLAVQLGLAAGDVSLGPAFWLEGDADEARIAQTAAAYLANHIEDVRIAGPGGVLEGTLQTPGGTGPFPLVVCFTGGGPNARGAFKLLDERLVAAGIASFEFDKRGIGKSTGTFDDSIPVVQDDAVAVVRALRLRPEIDSTRIAVCGLSQGGVIGPFVAANDPKIAAVVMFAGPVGARSTMFLGGLRTRMIAKHSPAAVDRIIDAVRVWMDARVAKEPKERIAALRAAAVDAFATDGTTPADAEGMVAVLDMPMLLSMYDVSPDKTLSKVRAPVLALYAEKDTVVNTADTVPAAKAALRSNLDATIVVIPGATHGFRLESDSAGYPVSIPQVLDLVTGWLVARLHPKSGEPR